MLVIQNTHGFSLDELKERVDPVGNALDVTETGLKVCESSTCVGIRQVVKKAGAFGNAVELVVECGAGDGPCVAQLAELAADEVFFAGGIWTGVIYLSAKHFLLPSLGNLLAALQEQTPSATPLMNDGSFQRYTNEDGSSAFPMGSKNSPYNCEAGYAASGTMC